MILHRGKLVYYGSQERLRGKYLPIDKMFISYHGKIPAMDDLPIRKYTIEKDSISLEYNHNYISSLEVLEVILSQTNVLDVKIEKSDLEYSNADYQWRKTMSFIEVNHISKAYRISKRKSGIPGMVANLIAPKYEKKEAVRDISFSIEKGEMVGFVGPNGAGKSTTIKMLSGILYPDSGEIKVNGFIPYIQRKKYVGSIGVVFGQKSQLQWDLPVKDSFELLKAIYSIPNDVYMKNLDRFTQMLDMSGFINQPVRQLSLGQRMRADIAAALLHSPEIVFFDEPTIGVDVVGKEAIRNFIRELNKEDKVTMIFTTHDMQDIEKTCNRLVIIDDGLLLYDGELNGVRKFNGVERRIDVIFVEDTTVEPMEHIELAEIDPRHIQLIFDNNKVSINDLMSDLLSKYNVKDINISEPDIESIIRKIYSREKVCV